VEADADWAALSRLRSALTAAPDLYWRCWLTAINLVGLVVVVGALFDVGLVVGAGRTGIYRRSLYPLAPPALTLGAALAERRRRRVALSGGLLAGYVAALAAVGVVGESIRNAPGYPAAGLVGCLALAALGGALARRARTVDGEA
jgi:hypothetical protein